MIVGEPTRVLNANIWEREANDWYREPKWCSRRLFDDYRFDGYVDDPACGKGNIISAAILAGYSVTASDIVNRTGNTSTDDFFQSKALRDNIVSNPPFERLEDFALHALKLVRHTPRNGGRVALIFPVRRLPAAGVWLETTPLKYVSYMTPRPSIPTGQLYDKLEAQGKEPSGGVQDFCWTIWEHGHSGPPMIKWLHRDHQPLSKDQRL
jgi:hypothetical protein